MRQSEAGGSRYFSLAYSLPIALILTFLSPFLRPAILANHALVTACERPLLLTNIRCRGKSFIVHPHGNSVRRRRIFELNNRTRLMKSQEFEMKGRIRAPYYPAEHHGMCFFIQGLDGLLDIVANLGVETVLDC